MKANKLDNTGRRKRLVRILKAVGVLALLVALCFAYTQLRTLWLNQCVITDVDRQVTIVEGKMVKSGTVAMEFELKPGANLALIDFRRKRLELLKKIPNLRDLTVVRHLPDRVTITVEERIPVARMNVKGRKTTSNRVVDTEGVVFTCRRGTQTLPVLREAVAPGTAPGQRITGHTLAALQLLELCSEKFGELGVLEADASKPDFIVLTLGNYSAAVVAWEGMDEETASSRQNLMKQLEHLTEVISSNIDNGTTIWNATQPGRVFADPQKGFL